MTFTRGQQKNYSTSNSPSEIWSKFKLIKTGHFNSNINHINNGAPINIADKSNDNCGNNNKGNQY